MLDSNGMAQQVNRFFGFGRAMIMQHGNFWIQASLMYNRGAPFLPWVNQLILGNNASILYAFLFGLFFLQSRW
jgi:hypothetical protein